MNYKEIIDQNKRILFLVNSKESYGRLRKLLDISGSMPQKKNGSGFIRIGMTSNIINAVHSSRFDIIACERVPTDTELDYLLPALVFNGDILGFYI